MLNLPQDKHIRLVAQADWNTLKGQDQLIKAPALLPQNMVVVFAGGGSKQKISATDQQTKP